MIICLIGLGIIVLLWLYYILTCIAEKKYKYYNAKIWHFYDVIKGTEEETPKNIADNNYYEKKRDIWNKFYTVDTCSLAQIIGLLNAIIILIIFLLFTGFKSEGGKDYKEYLLIKETIEYCIDNDIKADNSLLEKSIHINKEIANHKQDKQNPWFSWFVYNDICEVEGINLDYFK